jgi:lysophospholipase L1-like esterase
MATPITREKYEWSNNWWNNADDPTLPRVLLIGDSISCGYGPFVIERLTGHVNVDRMANSRGPHDPILFKEIRLALEDWPYKVIHFNNGLHAGHLTDDQYAQCLKDYLRLIKQFAGTAHLIWASSTPVFQTVEGYPLNESVNSQVIRRNAVAAEIMAENNIPINDLYTLVIGNNLRAVDGYHYNEQGYRLMANAVADRILNLLKL